MNSAIRVCKGVQIQGTIFSEYLNTDVDQDEFNLAFLEMCEQHGWLFGGGTSEIDDSDE